MCVRRKNEGKSIHIRSFKFSVYFTTKKKKNYFFYFTHPLLQNTYTSLSILHIYPIKYSIFYIFYYFLPSPLSSLEPSHRPNTNPKSPTPNRQPPTSPSSYSHRNWDSEKSLCEAKLKRFRPKRNMCLLNASERDRTENCPLDGAKIFVKEFCDKVEDENGESEACVSHSDVEGKTNLWVA